MPSAMAPLDTSNTFFPSARIWASCAAQRPIAAASRPRPSFVTSEEPTFTTSVLAFSIKRISLTQLAGDRFGHRCAPLPGESGHFEPGPLPAQRAQRFCDARIRVVDRIDLVEDEPARLALQPLAVIFQLGGDHARILGRLFRRQVDDVEEDSRPAEVSQELVAEA